MVKHILFINGLLYFQIQGRYLDRGAPASGFYYPGGQWFAACMIEKKKTRISSRIQAFFSYSMLELLKKFGCSIFFELKQWERRQRYLLQQPNEAQHVGPKNDRHFRQPKSL